MTKTKKLKLLSSKIRKYDHSTNSYFLEEDPNQEERLNKMHKVSYVSYDNGETNKFHSIEDAALQVSSKDLKYKEFYINGILYNKDTFKDLIDVSKMDTLFLTDKVFAN